MIHGIGIDIVKTERIQKATDRWGERFLRRVFTGNEIAYCYDKKNPYPSLSVRFAAKEAFIKAAGLRTAVALTDIEVSNDVAGKPAICVKGGLERFMAEQSLRQFHLSLSHEREYCTACVVIEK